MLLHGHRGSHTDFDCFNDLLFLRASSAICSCRSALGCGWEGDTSWTTLVHPLCAGLVGRSLMHVLALHWFVCSPIWPYKDPKLSFSSIILCLHDWMAPSPQLPDEKSEVVRMQQGSLSARGHIPELGRTLGLLGGFTLGLPLPCGSQLHLLMHPPQLNTVDHLHMASLLSCHLAGLHLSRPAAPRPTGTALLELGQSIYCSAPRRQRSAGLWPSSALPPTFTGSSKHQLSHLQWLLLKPFRATQPPSAFYRWKNWCICPGPGLPSSKTHAFCKIPFPCQRANSHVGSSEKRLVLESRWERLEVQAREVVGPCLRLRASVFSSLCSSVLPILLPGPHVLMMVATSTSAYVWPSFAQCSLCLRTCAFHPPLCPLPAHSAATMLASLPPL